MKITLDFAKLFAAVTEEQIAEVLADQAANHKQYGNTFNWYWWHWLRLDGKIHTKFWNRVLADRRHGDSGLFCEASIWLKDQGRAGLSPYVLLAAALRPVAHEVQRANPDRLQVVWKLYVTDERMMKEMRDSGLLITL